VLVLSFSGPNTSTTGSTGALHQYSTMQAPMKGVTMKRVTSSLLVFAIGVVLIYAVTGSLHTQAASGKPLVTEAVIQPQAQTITSHSHNYYVVTGPPSITVERIRAILCAWGKADTPHVSPACGSEQDLYDLGQAYHIDPAYALAWFLKESTLGRYGIARTNLGIGNIRCTDDYLQVSGHFCLYGFRAYHTYRAGYEEWYQLIRFYIDSWHLATVAAIVERYAPRSENDTDGYTLFVERCVDTWRARA